VVLLDPTIKEGHPLWLGYRNWERTPSISVNTIPSGPPRDSLFNDFTYWAQKQGAVSCRIDLKHLNKDARFAMQVLLHLVGAEWLMMGEYVRARLTQIEWELSFPSHFGGLPVTMDSALSKLHVWRRLIALYREMLNETISRVSNFSSLIMTSKFEDGARKAKSISDSKASVVGEDEERCESGLSAIANHGHTQSIAVFLDDFQNILVRMDELQQRVDRLTDVFSTGISIQDSRQALAAFQESKSVGRLTWLATVFIPLNFVCALFSMQPDVTTLHETIRRYLRVALPLAAGCVGFVFLLSVVSAWRRRLRW
jgi:hypothetical protein